VVRLLSVATIFALFPKIQTISGGHPVFNGYPGYILWGEAAGGLKAENVPPTRMSGTLLLLPPYTFMEWT